MARLKEQAIEILQDIPEDKAAIVVEMLKALRSLYTQTGETVGCVDTASNALGVFSKYANPDLIPLEKAAWGEAVKEKHATH